MLIKGLRMENVYMPGSDLWVFSFGRAGNLIFHPSPRNGFFFLSPEKPINPPSPSARVMWLRKRIKNLRITGLMNFWPQRRMVFELSPSRVFLALDLKQGLSLEHTAPSPPTPVDWPDLRQIVADQDIWKMYPHITPPLRSALGQLDSEDARKLLEDLSQAKPRGFYILTKPGKKESLSCFQASPWLVRRTFDSALSAALEFGLPRVQAMVDRTADKNRADQVRVRRIRKNLEKIEQDKERLARMIELSRDGEFIKSNLYRLNPDSRQKEISLVEPDGTARTLSLRPELTVRENMERFFKRAAKGRRGLDFVRKREKELQKSLSSPYEHESTVKKDGVSSRKAGTAGKKAKSGSEVHYYRSSDGFLILRARNRKAGHRLLSTGAARHDLWFHVQGGPGAHVILKRDHDLVQVSERAIEEAAGLAALASYKKDDAKAGVYCARVRDVRKVKGLEQGMVHVDRMLRTVQVKLDPDLESRLRQT